MKALKKILKVTGLVSLLLLIAVVLYIASSGPTLPIETNNIIKKVLESPLPEMVKGETDFANSQGINIWYESISPQQSSKGVILLIMGISNDALGWPPNFIQSFVDSGYQVIRFDHRGTGMSDWVENWDVKNPYSLQDMANDGISVLDHLGICKANIIGVSMGGMIAQELTINYPNRVQSLTSIMSSGNIFDNELPPISSSVAYDLIKTALKYGIINTDKSIIKLHIASRIILMGEARQNVDVKEISEQVLYNIRKRKGYNMNVSKQHQAAVSLSGSRYSNLKALKTPTLIIHGISDPFIPIEHGKKCASIIPNADSMWVENMGHDLPNGLIPIISKRIIRNFNRSIE